MSDREARAWAEKEAVEQDLKREKAKMRWLCSQLERLCDGRHHDMDAGKTAEQWEMLAELFAELGRQGGAGCRTK